MDKIQWTENCTGWLSPWSCSLFLILVFFVELNYLTLGNSGL